MKPQIIIPKHQWERQFQQGAWDYLDSSSIERARSAVIGMYCRSLKPSGTILDVGCGEGTLFDFLNDKQKSAYTGIDISDVAVAKAKKKRKGNFYATDAMEFVSKRRLDIIVFNEVLYYLDEIETFQRYSSLLKPNGIVIISLYRTKNLHYDKRTWKNAKRFFTIIDSIEITGTAKRMKVTWKIAVLKLKPAKS